jgi:hypothetical protein
MSGTFNPGAGCRDRLGIIDEGSPEDFPPEGGRVCTRIGKSRITATVAPSGHSSPDGHASHQSGSLEKHHQFDPRLRARHVNNGESRDRKSLLPEWSPLVPQGSASGKFHPPETLQAKGGKLPSGESLASFRIGGDSIGMPELGMQIPVA